MTTASSMAPPSNPLPPSPTKTTASPITPNSRHAFPPRPHNLHHKREDNQREVVRFAPHPKYKRRVRKKKKFQAHNPKNQFEIRDMVQLEKCKPISKKTTFLAILVPKRTASKSALTSALEQASELGLALESYSSSQF